MENLKRLYRHVVLVPGLVPRMLHSQDTGVVFMLHRFRDPEIGSVGHDPKQVSAMLEYLRKGGYELISLHDMFRRALEGRSLRGAIAFSIDDGYLDHALVGAPLFARFDCPVTTFLTTDFIDRRMWFWWDRIEYVYENTAKRSFDVLSPAFNLICNWSDQASRNSCKERFISECKKIPDVDKNTAIECLAAAAEVPIPENPPTKYLPLSWELARRCEQDGMSFGPHTVTHPILARTEDPQSQYEIEQSWLRVLAELADPVPVFCYPNGQASDFGPRETATLQRLGLDGAVSGIPGYATGAEIRSPHERYAIRRFSMPADLADLVQNVTGLDAIKNRVRSIWS